MTNSEKDLILTWANYNQKLSQAFRRYLDSQLFCNVTLSAEGRTVKCHQEILSACSNWFENILSSVENYQHPIILLKDVSFIELEYIVNFMYSGEVVVPQEEIQSFLKTAELLEIKGLLDRQEEKKVTKQPSSSPRPKESPVCFNNGELTVTTKKVEKEEICSQINSLVIYNQINNHMQNLKPPPRSNPLVRAYEANKRKSESSCSNHESKKSSRSYEPNVPVFDNRHIYASDLVQSHFDPPGVICILCVFTLLLPLFTFTRHLYFIPKIVLLNSKHFMFTFSGDTEDGSEDTPPASGTEDCGPFKKVWSYRYLCYNLGKEILCLLCFCRFTQFKKFNLDRHMRNKHPYLYHIDDEAKKRVLDMVRELELKFDYLLIKWDFVVFVVSWHKRGSHDDQCVLQYVARYEENVTPGMIASVPSQGNEQMAASILQVFPIQPPSTQV